MSSDKVNKVNRILEDAMLQYRLSQKDLAKKLEISPSYVTQLLQGKKTASEKLVRLIEFTFPKLTREVSVAVQQENGERGRHPDPQIEAVIKMMESMDEEGKKDIRLGVEKEKLLRELLQQRETKKAG